MLKFYSQCNGWCWGLEGPIKGVCVIGFCPHQGNNVTSLDWIIIIIIITPHCSFSYGTGLVTGKACFYNGILPVPCVLYSRFTWLSFHFSIMLHVMCSSPETMQMSAVLLDFQLPEPGGKRIFFFLYECSSLWYSIIATEIRLL